jgi:hypothetical protein
VLGKEIGNKEQNNTLSLLPMDTKDLIKLINDESLPWYPDPCVLVVDSD